MNLKITKNVIVIGAGRLGASLAGSLSEKGFHVTIIDKDNTAFRKLPENFSGYRVFADGSDIDVLEDVGIKNADMVIATTSNDNVNCLIAQISSQIYDISKVYMRSSDTDIEKIIDGFNIEVIYPFKLSAHEIERLISIDMGEVTSL